MNIVRRASGYYGKKATHILLTASEMVERNTTEDVFVFTIRTHPSRILTMQNTPLYAFRASAVVPKSKKNSAPLNTLIHSIRFTLNTVQMLDFHDF